ncbi:MAG: sigma-70 family RNA polymerase sigma factor [Mobilicoccus sp.]|nr:sigma-70 family RNA polymerase sigma factor [Mobilicoccus sp.]
MFRHAATLTDVAEQQACLDEIVLLNARVAEALANRYAQRGADPEDLVQVAYLGLIKAVQGYNVGEGPGFLAYAVPTISGEIKRYFRDYSWMVRPPRRLQELRSAAATSSADLEQAWGRPPTKTELAADLGVSVDELAEAEQARGGFNALSLDAPVREEGSPSLSDMLVADQDEFGQIENVEMLRPALATLSPRDREILLLRFVRGLTQEQIGHEIGVSQMQVSRLLTKILAGLRDVLDSPEQVAAY